VKLRFSPVSLYLCVFCCFIDVVLRVSAAGGDFTCSRVSSIR
jgi:hypothetical protein